MRYIHSQLQHSKTEEVQLGSSKDYDQSQLGGGMEGVSHRRLGVDLGKTQRFLRMQKYEAFSEADCVNTMKKDSFLGDCQNFGSQVCPDDIPATR